MSNKIITYIQFLKKLKQFFVGEGLLSKLKKHQIHYLIIFNTCPEKIKKHLSELMIDKEKICVVDENIINPVQIGYEKLNAFGTKHILGARIIEEIKKEVQDVKEK